MQLKSNTARVLKIPGKGERKKTKQKKQVSLLFWKRLSGLERRFFISRRSSFLPLWKGFSKFNKKYGCVLAFQKGEGSDHYAFIYHLEMMH